MLLNLRFKVFRPIINKFSALWIGGCWEAKIRRYFRLSRHLYVSTDGNDEANGLSWDTRRASLSAIEEIVRPGDTVFLGPGRYTAKITKSGGPIT